MYRNREVVAFVSTDSQAQRKTFETKLTRVCNYGRCLGFQLKTIVFAFKHSISVFSPNIHKSCRKIGS